ncbi:uncharacterized protein SPSK_10316 [Sporothrix schenckii 1099-18]|uniref:Uncharacterized protein n=1 Tax=Sporothrix schenckii 1099-18 TaxID=1397361 RepID=A0A0F2LRI2_SPOSC|nr:uncharacterized protein SPSK_10316 [Sporothrix schenckii 1099-18]KJR80117.1 hypothetical protein SPSK_10316 [Sporothrix schenckii 1099-18]
MSESTSQPHLPLVPQCAACGDTIHRHERIVAMLGNDGATAYSGRITRPFPFPQHGMILTDVDGLLPCRIPLHSCSACRRAPMAVLVHYDCCHVFQKGHICLQNRQDARVVEDSADPKQKRQVQLAAKDPGDQKQTRNEDHCVDPNSKQEGNRGTDILDELWILGAWRRPWSRAAQLHLEDAGPATYSDAELGVFARVAALAGLPILAKLPLELVCLVYKLSAPSLFWRSVRCLGLWAMRRTNPLHLAPLAQVVSWQRWHPLQLAEAVSSPGHSCLPRSSLPPFIRITIDRQGICQIERLHEMPKYAGQTTTRFAFIVEMVSASPALADVLVEKKLRRHIPSQLYAVDVYRCFGLTFFYLTGKIYGVHVHRTAHDTAMETYQRLVTRVKENMVWALLPIAPNDRVMALWACQREHGITIVARMELAGDVAVGRACGRSSKTICLSRGNQMTFVYGEPFESEPVKIVGACSGETQSIDDAGRLVQPALSVQTTSATRFPDTYVSSAPLRDIRSVRVFYANGTCRGLLLRYKNGGVRALGECRLFVDESWVVDHPAVICYRPLQYRAYKHVYHDGIAVDVARTARHCHNEDGWECHDISQGVLHLHYTTNRSYTMSYEPKSQ